MSAPIFLPDIEADVFFDGALPATSVRTTGKYQSVNCFLVSRDLRVKVRVRSSQWRSVPIGIHSAAGVYYMHWRGSATEHFQRGDSFELWAESRIGSGIVLATRHPGETDDED